MKWAETIDGRFVLKWGNYTLAELKELKKISWGAYGYTTRTTGVYDVIVLGYRHNTYVGLDIARTEAEKVVLKETYRLVHELELMI